MVEEDLFDANKPTQNTKERRRARRFDPNGLKGVSIYFELIGMEEKLKSSKPQEYIQLMGPGKFRGSGYKLHLFSLTLDDVLELTHATFGLAKANGCLMKVATVQTLNGNASDHQRGKGVTIYLPISMNEEGRRTFITQLDAQIKTCGYKQGQAIEQDQYYGGCINGRYDCTLPPEEVIKRKGLTFEEMGKYYKK